MKKQFLLFTLVLIGLFMLPGISKAAVTPISGNVDPEVSTEAAPQWYTIMSSHLSDPNRQNRFMVWDGTRLKTEKFDAGIPEDQLADKYLWRLERGSADNKVYIVNKTGLRIYAPDGVNPTSNAALTVNESGAEWEMKLASATGQSGCADKQYCFNFLGALVTPAYLNAMDSQNDTDMAFGVTVYNAGVHQASGWFFYKANVQEKTKYTVTFAEPENGTIQVTNAQGEEIASNTQLAEGTEIHINITPAEFYGITSVLVNDEEQIENLTEENGTYSYVTTVTADIVIAATFNQISYCIPTANDRLSDTERRLKTITISGATLDGEDAPFSNTLNNDPQPKVYLDATDVTITASKKDELTISWDFRNDISWMHYYVYIDYNHDGVFNETNELVSFTYYNEVDEGPASNSVGVIVGAGDNFTSAPKFTIPEDALTGKTRLRFKVDWNSKDPCGRPGPENPIGANRGTVLDYTIDIHPAAAIATSTITLPESVENGTLTVKAGDKDIMNGDEVNNGTELTITATPANGYVLDYLKINDTPFTESVYTVTEDAVITVAFVKAPVVNNNKAITIPQTSGRTGYRLEVPETILGDRSGTETDRTGKSFTLSSWVNIDKFTNDSKNKGNIIMGHGPQVHMNYNGSLILGTTETGTLKIISGASNGINQTLSAEISLNTWTYLTLIYDNDTHKISVYKDGISAGEDMQLSKELELFGDEPCIFFVGGMGFSGLCDELQFFNKALTADEVQQAYQAPQDMPNLTAWYDFNSIDGNSEGSFLNKATVADKASEQAVFYKYTGNTSSDPGLISGSVVEAAPALAEGRAPAVAQYTITLPMEVANGTLTVMNGETPLVAGENQIEEGTELTITATPADGYVLDYLKINDTPLTESIYTVTEDAVIAVAFKESSVAGAPKAIHVPTNNGDVKYQFRFDDIVLGEHKNGTNNNWNDGIVDKGDHRARNFTMSVWIKPLNSGIGDLFGHAQTAFYDAQGTFAARINADNQLVLKSRAWVNGSQCDGINDIVSDVTLDINEWAFLTVAVDDDARTINLYKNGVLAATGDLSKTKEGKDAHGIGLLADECVFFVGNGKASCDVDEIQVWNQTLSVEEIVASMEGYANAPENLIAFYKFDENSIENIPNQGTGGVCNANLVSGTEKYDPAVWGNVYTCSPIQATLVDGHTLTKFTVNYVAETEHGSFVVKNGDDIIVSGSEVSQHQTLTIEVTPAEGYQVKNIKVNDVAIEGNTFVLEEESTVTVEFTDKLFVKYTVSEGGTFTVVDENDPENPFNNGDEFKRNSFIIMMISADDNYEISNFTVNGEDKKSSITGGVYMIPNCTTNLDINVEFAKKQFNIAFSSNEFGTLTVKNNNTIIANNSSVEYGTELTITAKPTGAATLSAFTINGVNRLDEIKDAMTMNITVTEALDIKAEFEAVKRAVTCNITGNGSVKITDDKDNVYENGVASIPDGANITITFIPEEGYELGDFIFDGETLFGDVIDNKYDFPNIDDDYTFDVSFIVASSIHNESAETIVVRYESGTLYVNGMNAGDKLDIYDITGKYIKASETLETNVSELANGCYLVRLSTGNVIKTVKFIKR